MNRTVTLVSGLFFGLLAAATVSACGSQLGGQATAGAGVATSSVSGAASLSGLDSTTAPDAKIDLTAATDAVISGGAPASGAAGSGTTGSSNTGSGTAASGTAGSGGSTSSAASHGSGTHGSASGSSASNDSSAHHGGSSSSTTSPAPKIVSASLSCTYSAYDSSYHLFLDYELSGATGMALSIDNPGIVGSFGTYGWHGQVELPANGCYASYGEQTYTLYSIGGVGPQASKTLTRTGTLTQAASTTTSSTTTTSAPSTTSPAPKIVSASLSCTYSAYSSSYHLFLDYELSGATGMALSIDNPGIVGSFGTYGWHGQVELPANGCYASYGEQTYTIYSIGGVGPQASKTLTRTGTHTQASSTTTSSTTTTSAPSTTSAITTITAGSAVSSATSAAITTVTVS